MRFRFSVTEMVSYDRVLVVSYELQSFPLFYVNFSLDRTVTEAMASSPVARNPSCLNCNYADPSLDDRTKLLYNLVFPKESDSHDKADHLLFTVPQVAESCVILCPEPNNRAETTHP